MDRRDVIAADAVTVRVHRHVLLERVSVAAHGGELLAILGPNGAGKSTLLKVLAGDIEPASGDVHMAGRALRAWSARERACMRSVLPQQATLGFAFTAREVVEFGRFPHNEGALDRHDREICERALELMDAQGLAGRDYTTLSGGERARVHAARAFAQVWEAWNEQPRVLLLDEPTAALDLRHQGQLLASASEFAHARGVAVVAVLHDINLAARFADRIVWMQLGRVVAQGTPDEMLSGELIGSIYGIDAVVVRHPVHDALLVAT